MPASARNCRDCRLCTERGIVHGLKTAGKVTLAICTLGLYVIAAKLFNSGRKMCPACGHAMTEHAVVEGRFKD